MSHLVVIAFYCYIFVGVVLFIDSSQVFGVVDADDFVSLSVDDQHFTIESYYLSFIIEMLLYDVAQTSKEIRGHFFYCIEGRY